MIRKFYTISRNVDCPHTQSEILDFVEAVLALPENLQGVLVEAGSYKGGSTAKFSLTAHAAHRELVAFDSFQGLPQHGEFPQRTIFGQTVDLKPGGCSGTPSDVRRALQKFGNPRICRLIEGWFEDTMPSFKSPIAAVYLDVVLASSTRTCLKHLYPLLGIGGVLYSQDGHLPRVVDVFSDDDFWEKDIGCPKPHVEGLGTHKLIKIVKAQ